MLLWGNRSIVLLYFHVLIAQAHRKYLPPRKAADALTHIVEEMQDELDRYMTGTLD